MGEYPCSHEEPAGADAPARAPRVAALVVTCNRLAQLRPTLARLLADPVDHVLVFDNGSDDGTADWLAAQDDPRLLVVRSAQNLGGAGGFARAMEQARDRLRPDWMLLLDDDARPEPGALATFRELEAAGTLAPWDALAAAVFYPDGTPCEMNRPIVNRLAGRAFVPTHLRPADYAGSALRPVAASSFVGFFVRRAAVERVGLPDESLFLYMDDGLYTLALTRAGLRLGFAPALRFEHDCRTLATRRTGFRPLWKAYYYHRNLLIFYRAAMGPLVWPALAYLLPRWALKARDQEGDAAAYLRLLARAVAHGLTGRRDRIGEG